MEVIKQYEQMWENFAASKKQMYLDYKFEPTHRIGLTNYLRERAILTEIKLTPQTTVLDVGCASGRQVLGLANKVKEGHGTDVAPSFIEKAKQVASELGYTNLFFHQATIEKLPFENNAFDVVICAEVLEHVFDKDVAVKELIRVLKPGGQLLITVPNMNADATVWGRLLRFINFRSFVPLEQFTPEEIMKHGDAHVREYTHNSLTSWLEKYTLDVRKCYSVSFIDGPYFDYLLKIPLRWSPLRLIIIRLEVLLSNLGYFLGRHLICNISKKNY